MGKNNRLIDNLATIAKRNREMNIDEAVKRQTPIFCAAMCIALKHMAPDVDAATLHDFLMEVQDVIDAHPTDIFRTCRQETGVIIKIDGMTKDERETESSKQYKGSIRTGR